MKITALKCTVLGNNVVLRIATEPGGAAAFAALLGETYRPQPGERLGVVISGGNTTAVDFGC